MGKLPSPHTVDEDLVESVQQTLAHAYLVGHSAELDSFVYAIYRLLGLRHRKATRLLGHHDDDSNVTPQYNRSALSIEIRTAAHTATQSDRTMYESWFTGAERPQPILTPSTDPLTQLLLSFAIILLYMSGLGILFLIKN